MASVKTLSELTCCAMGRVLPCCICIPSVYIGILDCRGIGIFILQIYVQALMIFTVKNSEIVSELYR